MPCAACCLRGVDCAGASDLLVCCAVWKGEEDEFEEFGDVEDAGRGVHYFFKKILRCSM